MKHVWSKKSILELFQHAEKNFETKMQLPSPYDAECFQFALWNFRRRTKIGQEKYKDYQINRDGNIITILNKPPIEIKPISDFTP